MCKNDRAIKYVNNFLWREKQNGVYARFAGDSIFLANNITNDEHEETLS